MRVAGKAAAVFLDPGAGAAFDFAGKSGVGGAECRHSSAEAQRVEGIDSEGAMAALRASNTASEMWTSAAGCIDERGVDDLHEFGVARRQAHEGKDSGWGRDSWRDCARVPGRVTLGDAANLLKEKTDAI